MAALARLLTLLAFFLSTLFFPTATTNGAPNCFPPDLQALRSFAATWHIREWVGEDCCSWAGVTCTAPHEAGAPARVSEIVYDADLQQYSDLSSLCNLSALTHFRFNPYFPLNFKGSSSLVISDCLGTQLQHLIDFSLVVQQQDPYSSVTNYVTSSFPPSFSGLRSLQNLRLEGLEISRESLLPITALPNLSTLYLASCVFPDPFNFSRLPSRLISLTLERCSISGPLSPFTNTPLLQELDLFGNFLNSTLLDFALHSNLPRLTELTLSENSLSGSFPASMARFRNLQSLYLGSNLLTGTLPDTLCQLTNLTLLYLDDNGFSGDNLSQCHSLTRLHDLTLEDNQFSGPFPTWIGGLFSLASLKLSSNHFSGPLPQEWQHLSRLRELGLSHNVITPNTATGLRLPDWIFRLPKLENLFLGSTGLESKDCGCYGRLSLLNQTLRDIDLSQNNLTGANTLECFTLYNFSISSFIFLNLTGNPLSFSLSHTQLPPSIFDIDLSSCLLEGSLTDKFFELVPGQVNSIALANNNLVGTIPTKLMNLSIGYSLDLSHNSFTGFVADQSFLGTPWNILLSHNALSGDLPSYMLAIFLGLPPESCSIYELTSDPGDFIHSVDLSHNNLTGTIPTSFSTVPCGLSYFHRVKFDNNHLVGMIPDELGGTQTLQTLTLNNNHLAGTIPSSILNTTSLKVLDLSYNELQGDFETLISSISPPTHLRVLILGHNRITGSIPPSFGTFAPALQVIDLSHNNLTGNIPPNLELPEFHVVQMEASKSTSILFEEIKIVVKGVYQTYVYELQVLTSLDVSHNLLVGAIPSQLGEFSGLRYLNLSENMLSGWIPAGLSKLHVLEALDLSYNRLQGKIPSDLSILSSLEVFDVSFNKALEGTIPTGPQFESSKSFRGDPDLCGYPVLRHCNTVEEGASTPNSLEEGGSQEGKPILEWIKEWVSLPGLGLGIVFGFGGTLWLMHGTYCLFKIGARFMVSIS